MSAFRQVTKMLIFSVWVLGLLTHLGCKKDDDNGLDNLIGAWTADGGSVVASVAGMEIFSGDLTSTGSFTFNADSTGSVDLRLMFDSSESTLSGSFNWVRNGDVITLNQNTSNETKFTRVKNEKNLQELAFTQNDATQNATVDYVLRLRRQ